jgi:hypothetical protein
MLLGLIMAVGVSAASAAVTISVNPHITYAAVGETIKVYLWKDLPDTQFDGYETVIRYNPSELRYISAAEETVMTKSCSNRWWVANPASGTLFISHVRMCPPLTLVTGPGALSSIRFKVLAEGRLVITQDYFWFTKEGYWIKNTAWTDGLVLVGSAGVGGGTVPEPAAVVHAAPNPGKEFTFSTDTASGRLAVYDVSGRLVRTLAGDEGAPGCGFWDGKDELGGLCPPGIYFVAPGGAERSRACPLVLVR